MTENQITDEDSPIVRLVNQIIANGVAQRASDIHFDPQETELKIRYRVDGVLREGAFITKKHAKYYHCPCENYGELKYYRKSYSARWSD